MKHNIESEWNRYCAKMRCTNISFLSSHYFPAVHIWLNTFHWYNVNVDVNVKCTFLIIACFNFFIQSFNLNDFFPLSSCLTKLRAKIFCFFFLSLCNSQQSWSYLFWLLWRLPSKISCIDWGFSLSFMMSSVRLYNVQCT